jgi:hypothetical protein
VADGCGPAGSVRIKSVIRIYIRENDKEA